MINVFRKIVFVIFYFIRKVFRYKFALIQKSHANFHASQVLQVILILNFYFLTDSFKKAYLIQLSRNSQSHSTYMKKSLSFSLYEKVILI